MTGHYWTDELLDDLKRHEKYRRKPYRDTVGKTTVGYGRNLDDKGLSEEESEYLLRNDMREAIEGLDRAIPWWRGLSDARRRAFANMAVNLGLYGFLGFKKMLAAAERGDFAEAAREALDSRWAKQVKGRAREIAALLENG